MKKVAIYIRVSTQEQALHGYSIGEQRERLIAFCKAHDWLVGEVFTDSGYSGANLDRPGMQRLIEEIKEFDLVLVYKLDRLSRSQRDTLHLIEDIFLPAGVDFVSISESFDTSTPFGRAMVGILSVFAQLERETFKERSRMGMVARAKKGLWHGSGNPPIGYDYINDNLVINEYEAEQVREIFRLYIDGKSPIQIADYLREKGYTTKTSNPWAPKHRGTGVVRVLTNDIYTGTNRFGDVVVENAFSAIIDRETFEKAQQMKQKRSEIYSTSNCYKSKFLLTGMIFCARCGSRYFAYHKSRKTKTTSGYTYYACYSRVAPKSASAKAEHCDNINWRVDILEERVTKEVRSLLFHPKYYEKLLKKNKSEKNKKVENLEALSIRRKISDLDRKIARTMELYENDSIPADILSARIDVFYREKTALSSTLLKLEPPPAPKKDYDAEGIAGLLSQFSLVWDSAEIEEKRQILFSLVNRILIDGDEVKIEWAFLE